MPKPRSSSGKREREMRKRERERVKREKAALKRQRRHGEGSMAPPPPVNFAAADEQRWNNQDVLSLPPASAERSGEDGRTEGLAG